MIEPPILTGGGLLVRPYEPMDIDPHFEAALESIDAVYPWLPWCRPGYRRVYSEAWIETRVRDWEQGISYDFCITGARTGALLGGTGINHIDRENNFGNMGYWVRSGRTGEGIATQAAQLTAQFGFGTLGLTRIEIVVATGNGPSRRVAEKLGAAFEGTLRNRLTIPRGLSDAFLFSLVPDDIEKWECISD